MLKETAYNVDYGLIDQAEEFANSFDGKTALNRPVGNFFYDAWEIKEEFQNTVWAKILATLEEPHGEARIIVLQPGESYMGHADIDDRYHLNITGVNSFLIDIQNQKMYPTNADGIWYDMDAGSIHTASNYGNIPRAQLVVRKLLKRSKLEKFTHITITPKKSRYDYRYQFDNKISPWLNLMNKSNNINNFRHSVDKVEFDLSTSCLEQLLEMHHNIFDINYD